MKAKRWMSVWLCAALVMALTGCGANADPTEEGEPARHLPLGSKASGMGG